MIASEQCKWYTVSGIFQATYKCVQISRQTRADEVVKMILSGYGSDEPPEKFVLVESLSDSEGKLNILTICNRKKWKFCQYRKD